MASVLDLGPVGFEDAGHWSADTRYERRQCVRHNNAYWLAIEPGMGQEPADASPYWVMMIRGYENVRTPLVADTTLYIRAPEDGGSDENDGLSPQTAKATLRGMAVLLKNIDPRQYIVFVDIGAGSFEGMDNWAFHEFGVDNLYVNGAGDSTIITSPLFALCSLSNICMQAQLAGRHGSLWLRAYDSLGNITFGNNGYLQAYMGGMITVGCKIVINGSNTSTVIYSSGGGSITCTSSASFVAVNNPSFTYFAYARHFSCISFYTATFSGSATGQKWRTYVGGEITRQSGSLDDLLGDAEGKCVTGGPSRVGAQGVVRAAVVVTAAGSVYNGTVSFGITGVTKSGTGVYIVNHSFSSSEIASINVTLNVNGSGWTFGYTNVSTGTTVRTYKDSVLADCAFSFSLM